MKVHHINAATMCPVARKLVNGDGGLFDRGRMVCHCLVVETSKGLVLVDSGLGLDDVRAPVARLGGGFLRATGPTLDPAECAARQVEELGFSRRDVRHVVLTHLDLDHAGGIPDFPEAKVHVMADEHAAAMARATLRERERYRPAHWAHGPAWSTYAARGEAWKGFACVRELDGLVPEILLVPLAGHTRGHAAVAVDTGAGWLVHAGDAYFFHGEMDLERPRCTLGLALFQRLVAIDDALRRENQARLRELIRQHGRDVTVFSAHSPVELEALASKHAAGAAAAE
ncbi:MAG TPA: MBL fold metallo-hydrolase [Minicystis sp.]|nr:MBL fold metallo-hydrolase [Minicystis sp.]